MTLKTFEQLIATGCRIQVSFLKLEIQANIVNSVQLIEIKLHMTIVLF